MKKINLGLGSVGVVVCIALLSQLVFAQVQEASKKRNIVIHGSSSAMRMIKADAAAYANENKIGVSVVETQSMAGVICVREKKCDLTISSISITDKRVTGGDELEQTIYGIDSSVLITHPGVGVSTVTTEQVKDLLQSKITSWKELGGNDVLVALFRRDPANGGRDAEFFGAESNGGTIIKTSSEALNRTKLTPGGFASSGLGVVQEMEAKGEIKVLRINGFAPSPENLRSGQYPYLRTLKLIHRKDADEAVKAIAEHLLRIRPKTFERSGVVIP